MEEEDEAVEKDEAVEENEEDGEEEDDDKEDDDDEGDEGESPKDLLPLITCPGGGINLVIHTPRLLPKYITPHQS